MANRGICNFLRKPYIWVFFTHRGQTIRQMVLPISKIKNGRIMLKRFNACLIIPENISTSSRFIHLKSGTIVRYDKDSCFPLEQLNHKECEEIKGECNNPIDRFLNRHIDNVCYADEWHSPTFRPEKLKEFFEAEISQDILSSDKEGIPGWVPIIIVVALIAVILMFAIHSFMPPIVTNATYVLPEPTQAVVRVVNV